jgi:hypothetical protein
MNVLDLCSGDGGFSEAMVLADDNVVRVDIKPKFAKVPFTTIADVFTYEPPFYPDIVVAGPPCEAFSIARYPYEKAHGRHPQYDLMVAPARHCISFADKYPDALVVVENPIGRLRHEIGPPVETFDQCMYGRNARKRTDLWGNYLRWGSLKRMCDHSPHVGHVKAYSENPNGGMNGGWGRSGLDRQTAVERARLPLAFSEAVRRLRCK